MCRRDGESVCRVEDLHDRQLVWRQHSQSHRVARHLASPVICCHRAEFVRAFCLGAPSQLKRVICRDSDAVRADEILHLGYTTVWIAGVDLQNYHVRRLKDRSAFRSEPFHRRGQIGSLKRDGDRLSRNTGAPIVRRHDT